MTVPIHLSQVQAIQGAQGGTPKSTQWWRKLRRVHAGTQIPVKFGPTSARVGAPDESSCGPHLVIESPCLPKPKIERENAETVAAGVAEGLRRAPLLVAQHVPWEAPDYRSVRYPQTALVALNTFGNTDVRTTQVQRAMAGYLGTTAVTVTAVNASPGTPAPVLSFRAPDVYRGEELVVACQDQDLLAICKWTVTVQGKIQAGPFYLIGGRAPLNLQVLRDQAVAVNVILPTGDAFAVGIEVLMNGWTYPATKNTDGTYDKVLRSSPNWLREENFR